MANIIINSQFNPFTYEELLAPVLAATTEHKALEAELGALLTQASIWEKLANNENDKNAYNQYKAYIDDLNSKVNTLSELGLTPGARLGLYNAALRYSKEIVPIAQADEKRQKDIAAQQDIRLKDSSYIFDKIAADTGLDYYLKNGNLKYNGLSINEVYGTVAKDFQLAASKLMREGKWNTVLGGQYWEKLDQTGYTLNEIEAVLRGDENAPEELKQLYNSTLESYLSRGEWDESGQLAIKESINRGAFYGIGTLKSEYRENQNYLNPLQRKQLDGLNKPPKQPDYNRDYDKALIAFPKVTKKIPTILNKEGNLHSIKNNGEDITNLLFSNDGKLTKPENIEALKLTEEEQRVLKSMQSSRGGSRDVKDYEKLTWGSKLSRKNQLEQEYNKIIDIFEDMGFSEELILSMDRETVENNLLNILEENAIDGMDSEVYRFSLDESASKEFSEKVLIRNNGKVYSIDSMRDGEYKMGELRDMSKESSIDIHFDAIREEWIGKDEEGFFKLPKNMISTVDQKDVKNITETMKYYNEELKALQIKEYTQGLTERDIKMREKYLEIIDKEDMKLSDIGKNISHYVGKRNINTN